MDPSGGGVRYRRGALKRGALAGYSCGVGLVGMSSIALALISKAVSSIVF